MCVEPYSVSKYSYSVAARIVKCRLIMVPFVKMLIYIGQGPTSVMSDDLLVLSSSNMNIYELGYPPIVTFDIENSVNEMQE